MTNAAAWCALAVMAVGLVAIGIAGLLAINRAIVALERWQQKRRGWRTRRTCR